MSISIAEGEEHEILHTNHITTVHNLHADPVH